MKTKLYYSKILHQGSRWLLLMVMMLVTSLSLLYGQTPTFEEDFGPGYKEKEKRHVFNSRDRFGNAEGAVRIEGIGILETRKFANGEQKQQRTMSFWYYVASKNIYPSGPNPVNSRKTKQLINWISGTKPVEGLSASGGVLINNRYTGENPSRGKKFGLWLYKPVQFDKVGWYHIFYVQDKNYSRVVVYPPNNGAKQCSYNYFGAQSRSGTSLSYGGSNGQTITIDDLKYYDTSLTERDIETKHREEINPPSPPHGSLTLALKQNNTYLHTVRNNVTKGTEIETRFFDTSQSYKYTWTFEDAGNGAFRLRYGAGTYYLARKNAVDTKLILTDQKNSDLAKWKLEYGGSNGFRIRQANSTGTYLVYFGSKGTGVGTVRVATSGITEDNSLWEIKSAPKPVGHSMNWLSGQSVKVKGGETTFDQYWQLDVHLALAYKPSSSQLFRFLETEEKNEYIVQYVKNRKYARYGGNRRFGNSHVRNFNVNVPSNEPENAAHFHISKRDIDNSFNFYPADDAGGYYKRLSANVNSDIFQTTDPFIGVQATKIDILPVAPIHLDNGGRDKRSVPQASNLVLKPNPHNYTNEQEVSFTLDKAVASMRVGFYNPRTSKWLYQTEFKNLRKGKNTLTLKNVRSGLGATKPREQIKLGDKNPYALVGLVKVNGKNKEVFRRNDLVFMPLKTGNSNLPTITKFSITPKPVTEDKINVKLTSSKAVRLWYGVYELATNKRAYGKWIDTKKGPNAITMDKVRGGTGAGSGVTIKTNGTEYQVRVYASVNENGKTVSKEVVRSAKFLFKAKGSGNTGGSGLPTITKFSITPKPVTGDQINVKLTSSKAVRLWYGVYELATNKRAYGKWIDTKKGPNAITMDKVRGGTGAGSGVTIKTNGTEYQVRVLANVNENGKTVSKVVVRSAKFLFKAKGSGNTGGSALPKVKSLTVTPKPVTGDFINAKITVDKAGQYFYGVYEAGTGRRVYGKYFATVKGTSTIKMTAVRGGAGASPVGLKIKLGVASYEVGVSTLVKENGKNVFKRLKTTNKLSFKAKSGGGSGSGTSLPKVSNFSISPNPINTQKVTVKFQLSKAHKVFFGIYDKAAKKYLYKSKGVREVVREFAANRIHSVTLSQTRTGANADSGAGALKMNKEYEFRILTRDPSFRMVGYKKVTFRTISGGRLMERDAEAETKPVPTASAVYPNPITGDELKVTLSLSEAENVNFEVFDLIGKRVYHKQMTVGSGTTTTTLPQIRTSIQPRTASVYFLKAFDSQGKELITQRFVFE